MEDHPRIRGEHRIAPGWWGKRRGSSPHTRGARSPGRVGFPPRRIIPAYAGSTSSLQPRSSMGQDHPRIRGEHSTSGDALCMKVGSSPHTRGAREDHGGRRQMRRIIPAYAGSTSPSANAWGLLWDHPRIRGEHVIVAFAAVFHSGSSPHTRGAPRGSSWTWPAWRIIPAYAGSTAARASRRAPTTDHPRIRGEHYPDWQQNYSKLGSSPHTRGARVL